MIFFNCQLIVIPSHHSLILLDPTILNHLYPWLRIEFLEVAAHWLWLNVLHIRHRLEHFQYCDVSFGFEQFKLPVQLSRLYRLTLHLLSLVNLTFRLTLDLLFFLLFFLYELLVHLVFDVVAKHNSLVHFHLRVGQSIRKGQLVGLLYLNDLTLIVKGNILRGVSRSSR